MRDSLSLTEQQKNKIISYKEKYSAALERYQLRPIKEEAFYESYPGVWLLSDFVAGNCCQYPQLIEDLFSSGDILKNYEQGYYQRQLKSLLGNVDSEEELMKLLRGFRRREIMRLIWRDLVGWTDLENFLRELSELADTCINESNDVLQKWQKKSFGTPVDKHGNELSMLVVAVGKLGAQELNLSSDIDLIFAYPRRGETIGGAYAITNEEYFMRQAQRLLKVLHTITGEGFVFRVDMRLRPYGDSGPLVMTFEAMEAYYQEQGRDWERYALLRARVVNQKNKYSTELRNIIHSFVYRRYIDYGVLAALRDLKATIDREAREETATRDIKRGIGGIREIEFICQVYQLIFAGKYPDLCETGLIRVMPYLVKHQCIPENTIELLKRAYVFFRRVEHRIQAVADQQTHMLPSDDMQQQILARAMEFEDWETFLLTLSQHREAVAEAFQKTIASPKIVIPESKPKGIFEQLSSVWMGTVDDDDAIILLTQVGFDKATEAYWLLKSFRSSYRCRTLSPSAKQRLNAVMPIIIILLSDVKNPLDVLRRIITLLESIARRSAYLAMLWEHPDAFERLVKLCAESSWIAEQLALHPILLAELLESKNLYSPPNIEELNSELRQMLISIPRDDFEMQMNCLRRFKHIQMLRVAATDIIGELPVIDVSEHLSDIAAVVLKHTEITAEKSVVKNHGKPLQANRETSDPQFAIIAYGKLGSTELAYNSDLDLVFLHSSDNNQLQTEGPKNISHGEFYLRLGQRIIHYLQTHTADGVLYEVDTRLRPSGNSGLLVSSIDAFTEYQKNIAWTWEHQALIRARPICGNADICQQFIAVRREVLAQERDLEKLQADVLDMRQRITDSKLDKQKMNTFDLKLGVGGITDIDFIVQFLVLRWSYKFNSLLDNTATIQILKTLAEVNILQEKDVKFLIETYCRYRIDLHRQAIQSQDSYASAHLYETERKKVCELWYEVLGLKREF